MEENLVIYPEHIVSLAKHPKYFGRMSASTSSAFIKGPCGDEMEFYLVINDRVIEDVKFYTKGCIATVVCGSMTEQLSLVKSIDEALGISPKEIINKYKTFNNILEIGSAGGVDTFELAKHTKNKIIGIDISKDAVKIAKENLKKQSEAIKRKVVFCTTTALQEYSSYYKDPSINFYSKDKKLLEELRTESKGLTRVNAYKPDLCLEIDIEKKGKMLLTSKVRTIIDLFCNNQAYTSKELIEKTYGGRFG